MINLKETSTNINLNKSPQIYINNGYSNDIFIHEFKIIKDINLKIKNIRFYEKHKYISNKLCNKIIKEALILGLREEYNYNKKIKRVKDERTILIRK